MEEEITYITADYMYLVILGNKKTINNIANLLNKTSDSTQYLAVKLADPCATISRKKINKIFPTCKSNDYIIFDEGVEMSQTLIYSEDYDDGSYMVVSIEKRNDTNTISFPKIHLEDDMEPKNMMGDWIKKHELSKVMSAISIKHINTIKYENEILVVAAKIKKSFD